MRLPLLASLLLMIALIVPALSAGSALASSLRAPVEPAAPLLSDHPIVGTWLGTASFDPGRVLFGPDGTVVLKAPLATLADPAITLVSDATGTWEPINDTSATFTAVQTFTYVSGLYLGTATLVGYLTVSDDGSAFLDDRALSTITVRDGNGVIVSVRSADSLLPALAGTRIAEPLILTNAGTDRSGPMPGCSSCRRTP